MSDQRSHPFNWSLWLQWALLSTLGWVLGGSLFGEVGIGAWMGLLQWVLLRTVARQAGWWILASAAGWESGRLLVIYLLPPEQGIIAGAVIGVVLGLFQWAFLRRRFHRAGWWVVISALAWTVGLTGIFGTFWVGGATGVPTGFALELLARNPRFESLNPEPGRPSG